MLKLDKFAFKTLKTRPVVSDNVSTSILLQAGFIRQTMAGVYNYTTLGLRILRNIENVVREEMNNYGANEVLLSALSPRDLWEKTERWDKVDVLFKVPATDGKEYALNPTHEEVVTPLMNEFIESYKDAWKCVFQIQNKFRNEKRAKSGILRGREFLMKDAYSFHIDGTEFDEYYAGMQEVYMNIFKRLGLEEVTYMAVADGGDFTEKYSHEFQVAISIGEDNIYICEDCKTAHNEEVVDLEVGFKCSSCSSSNHKIEKASEVGNIFPLETKFSNAFGLKMADENNKAQDVIMGCYGIGISRLMWVIAEYCMTEKGITWPDSIAPASHYIIVMWDDNLEVATKLAQDFESQWNTVILDDRKGKKFGFWQKAGDCELFGIKNRIAITPKTLEQWGYELTVRGEASKIIVL